MVRPASCALPSLLSSPRPLTHARLCPLAQALEMTWGWEMASENVKSGYCEGLLRGYRGGLLTAADYNNLSQCENLDDVKLHLNTTDYGPYLANEPSPLHPATIVEKCTQKLVDEWNHLRCQARPVETCLRL
jgi:V-type H+-transporting ATPase subunit d